MLMWLYNLHSYNHINIVDRSTKKTHYPRFTDLTHSPQAPASIFLNAVVPHLSKIDLKLGKTSINNFL